MSNYTASNESIAVDDQSQLSTLGAIGTLQIFVNKAALVVVIFVMVIGLCLLYRFFQTKRRKSKSDRYRRLRKSNEKDTEEEDNPEITVYEKT